MSRDDVDDVTAGAAGSGEEAAADQEEAAAAVAGDSHENDLVMPGFRFHPTEEELIEFYLRRKVEGRRFNVELITFLDLYRFDPWELPAMAVIGEKEWFFYVPRDRKYRNGDRPNRVTASGYWKATGADRMIRGENSRPIGLKKTLVFYSGKAPKGVRSSWIMNEYRLPPPAADADLFYKSEISLCRVYKRSGIDDGHGHHQRPAGNVQASSSSAAARPPEQHSGNNTAAGLPACRHRPSPSSSSTTTAQQHTSFHQLLQGECSAAAAAAPPPPSLPASATTRNSNASQLLMPPPPPRPPCAAAYTSAAAAPTESAAVLAAASTYSLLAAAGSSSTHIDELSTLLAGHSHGGAYGNNHIVAGSHHHFPLPPSQLMPQLGTLPISPPLAAVSDKLWDWSSVPDTSTARDYDSSGFSDPK
uniref:NAC domain-containing protein n=1 Tax=Oryza rufipogon TaxID=4529 RepID=A0A0E0PML5_ORYRU